MRWYYGRWETAEVANKYTARSVLVGLMAMRMANIVQFGAKQFHQHYKISESLFLLFNFVIRIHAAYIRMSSSSIILYGNAS